MANSRSITSLGPRIVAVVDGESESVIQQFRSYRKAKVVLGAMESELDDLGDDRWAVLHGVKLR